MTVPKEENNRAENFKRNAALESLLHVVNNVLAPSEEAALKHYSCGHEDYPIVFVMGPHRSGTTLFIQWLANRGVVAYPTNLLSRFYGVPVVGAQIQLLLTDPRYNFRNELADLNGPMSYESENGKTKGVLAPNEFWYFWRRFLPFGELEWLSDEELFRVVNRERLVGELTALTRVFGKPFVLKGMILNYNISFLDAIFKKAVFVQMRRDPVTNVASILEARKRQFGSEREWYSFKIREYLRLKDLGAVEQSAGQVYYINKAVSQGIAAVEESRKLVVQYEDFCRDPRQVYERLVEKLDLHDRTYSGPALFEVTRADDVPDRAVIEKALASFAGS